MNSIPRGQVSGELESINPVQSIFESRESELRTDEERAMRRGMENKNPFKSVETDFDLLLVLIKDAVKKLCSSDTKEIGAQELQSLIRENNTPETLRSCIELLESGINEPDKLIKDSYILLLGYVAKAYKSKLLDPIDIVPSLLKTVARVCELIKRYLIVSINTNYRRVHLSYIIPVL